MNAPREILSVRDRLRAATQDIHQALHRAAPFANIADGAVTLESYRHTLQLLHRFHVLLSPLCVRGAKCLGRPELALAHTGRVAALEMDMACLGVTADVPDDAPPDGGEAFCAGVLYTVQGSTLGGKIIYRQLDALFLGDTGRGFFKGARADSSNWRELCDALESRPAEIAEMTAGALYAFECFQEMLTRRPALTPFPAGH
jgi:heme oxygenase